MAIVEIQLNRLGINSLELSTDAVDISGGTALHIRFINHGSPTHATLRCEATAYTSFTYENIYVEGEAELEIKILETAGSGSFDMQVITGYGMRRESFTIHVIKSCPVPAPEPIIFPESEDALPKKKMRTGGNGTGKVVMIAVMPIVAAVIIALWLYLPLNIDGLAMTLIIYIIMLAGVIIAWRSAQ